MIGGLSHLISRVSTYFFSPSKVQEPFPQGSGLSVRLFAWSFSQFKLRPSEQHLVVPSLPGLLTRASGGSSVVEAMEIFH